MHKLRPYRFVLLAGAALAAISGFILWILRFYGGYSWPAILTGALLLLFGSLVLLSLMDSGLTNINASASFYKQYREEKFKD